MQRVRHFIFSLSLLIPALASALSVGVGKTDLTPPIGTPSAGYKERKGVGMEGVHDPLLATALFIDNGKQKIVFCNVDNLGFMTDLFEKVKQQIQKEPGLETCQLFLGSSHTHSGGGSFINVPIIGPALAGNYDAAIAAFYVEKTVQAILQAARNTVEGKIGIGYGHAENLSRFRSAWPENVTPLSDVAVIKITRSDSSPFAVLFNYAMHPTVMRSVNRLFSSDFVGPARDHLQTLLGKEVQPIYFNGAQGDIDPQQSDNSFDICNAIGRSLAKTVQEIWDKTAVSDSLDIDLKKIAYDFQPQPTSAGLKLPVEIYHSEINAIVFNKTHAFITIPGELSTVYDARLKSVGKQLGFDQVSILGLTNDAHGYIILPEAWRKKTFESGTSFGGENYGDEIEQKAVFLLKSLSIR